MNCLQCANVINRSTVMARNGYSGCKQKPDWEFRATTMERACSSFVRASDDVLQTRNAWAGKAA